jgi:Na+/H+ antiporter NhaD/arsenite permease-like protein
MPVLNYLSIGIFSLVYALIVLRNFRRFQLPVWTIMLAGAVAMIFLNAIPLNDAYAAVNLDVIFFLIGMFAVVAAMEVSGLLEYLTLRMLGFARSPQRAFAVMFFGMGAMSAFLVNDTLALMATPIMLGVSKQMRIRPTVLLITLAMGVTVGSTLTPIGNPQNLLVALSSGISNPLLDFLHYLFLPTALCLATTYLVLRVYYRKDLAASSLEGFHAIPEKAIKHAKLAKLSAWTAGLVVLGFFAVSIARLFGVSGNFNLGTVALAGAAILFLVSEKRREILQSIDWGIIIFFISLFIVMEAFWRSNALQTLLAYAPTLNPADPNVSLGPILLTSLLFSQLLSNVPFVAVYIRVLQAAGFSGGNVKSWMALASASTLAGGLSLLGAASNVIVLEQAETRGAGFGFVEFAKVGLLVTIPNFLVLYAVLWIL